MAPRSDEASDIAASASAPAPHHGTRDRRPSVEAVASSTAGNGEGWVGDGAESRQLAKRARGSDRSAVAAAEEDEGFGSAGRGGRDRDAGRGSGRERGMKALFFSLCQHNNNSNY
jgi:hypothetical protein